MNKCSKCGLEGDYACSSIGCPGAVRHSVFWFKSFEAVPPPTLEQQIAELRGSITALQAEVRQLNRQLLELSLNTSLRMGKNG